MELGIQKAEIKRPSSYGVVTFVSLLAVCASATREQNRYIASQNLHASWKCSPLLRCVAHLHDTFGRRAIRYLCVLYHEPCHPMLGTC